MRGGLVAAVVSGVLLVAVPWASAGSRAPVADTPSMSVTASPHAARAHAVRLSLTLRYEMQCGFPGAGPLTVTFPSALKLPQRFPTGTVRLAGKPIAATVDGRRVTVTIARPKGVMCEVMGPGSVTLTFARSAQLANPARAGSYIFRATHLGRAFTAKLAVKPTA